jgi:hypothetical protein
MCDSHAPLDGADSVSRETPEEYRVKDEHELATESANTRAQVKRELEAVRLQIVLRQNTAKRELERTIGQLRDIDERIAEVTDEPA